MSASQIPDLSSAAFMADRHPTYRLLRDEHPHLRTTINAEPCIVLTRYADVDEMLRNPLATVQPMPGTFPQRIGVGNAARFYKESMPNIDPPDHTRIRRIVTPAFNPQTVAKMKAWVEEIIDRRLDALQAHEEVDFVAAFADPVPAEIACRLLHVPVEDGAMLFERQNALGAVLSVEDLTPERLAGADDAADFYYSYMNDVLDTLKGKLPADDFVAALMATEGQGGLSRSELITTLIGFLVASYHTTKVAMTNAVLAFLRHPEQREKLVAQPDLARPAWEEALRFDAPIHFIHRYAGEGLTVGGEPLPAGVRLLLGLHAANHDERRFAQADRFLIERQENRHLAFAGGAHFCLGSQLSRLEGDVLLRRIFRRFPKMAKRDTPLAFFPDLTFPAPLRLDIGLR